MTEIEPGGGSFRAFLLQHAEIVRRLAREGRLSSEMQEIISAVAPGVLKREKQEG